MEISREYSPSTGFLRSINGDSSLRDISHPIRHGRARDDWLWYLTTYFQTVRFSNLVIDRHVHFGQYLVAASGTES